MSTRAQRWQTLASTAFAQPLSAGTSSSAQIAILANDGNAALARDVTINWAGIRAWTTEIAHIGVHGNDRVQSRHRGHA